MMEKFCKMVFQRKKKQNKTLINIFIFSTIPTEIVIPLTTESLWLTAAFKMFSCAIVTGMDQ